MKEKSEFDNFSALTKRLLSVPKTEIDKRHKKWQQEKDRKRKPKKPSGRGDSAILAAMLKASEAPLMNTDATDLQTKNGPR